MSAVNLQNPILDGGIRSINFFNGRLLTGSDLTREQQANRELNRRLGQAVGDGIAYGFEVANSSLSTNASPVLKVEPGLAINRLGQTLQLARQIEIGLVRQGNSRTGSTHVFSECVPLQGGTYVAGAGAYLLTVAPAQTTEGLAATAGLDTGIASCNTDTIVSAVQFRLIQLDPPLTPAEVRDQNHLRNIIAYKCFGAADFRSFVANPFGPELKQYGLLDGLRPNRLTDCDVPLAVLYWTLTGGVIFVDLWSVRRPPTRLGSGGWSSFVSDRRQHEGEAMFLQFQEHIGSMRRSGANLRVLSATENFQYLPPVGVIPHATTTQPGFDYRRFFQDQTYREPVFMEGARLERLIRESLAYAPIKLGSGESMWLYEVRENKQTIAGSSVTPQSYLVFSSGHMPFFGDARFDVNRYDFSNYSSVYD